MADLRILSLMVVALCTLPTKPLYAFVLRPSANAGLMQQPTSQFYHAVYGAQLDVANEKETFLLRTAYTERPAFKSATYIDQEFATWVQIGQRLEHTKHLGISALVGGGQVWGFIKDTGTENPRREGFHLPGVVFSMEASLALSFMDLRLGHSLFAGQKDKSQLQAFVIWPYTFFYVSFSSPVSIQFGDERTH